MLHSESPTLRLVTLRRLVAKATAPLIFDAATDIGTVVHRLEASATRVAVLVDDGGVLEGTVCLDQLRDADHALPARAAMTMATPVLVSECDIGEARSAMMSHGSDRVAVITPAGQLLGVLTAADVGA